MRKASRGAAVGLLVCTLTLPLTTSATAQEAPALPDGVAVLADGLAGPLQVEVGPNGTTYVSEAFAGQVTAIDKKGRRSVLASDLGSFAPGIGVRGGQVLVTASDMGEDGQTAARLVHLSQGGQVVSSTDLLAYELAENPDQQVQFDGEGRELDALTNPYDVLALPGRTLIADAGANVINEVAANGRVSTLTKLPVSTEGACAGAPNNTVSGVGCDPVPTGIALGPDGYLYVSGLGAEVEGHVWKIDARTGEIVATWSDLPPLTGIAVAPDGTVYVSSAFTGAVLRLSPTGAVADDVELPFPTGLAFADGRLLVTSGFTGMLFSVAPSAF